MASQAKRKRGRPPAGHGGDKVSSYPQMTIRLPLETRAKLNTLSLLLNAPIWRIVDQAIDVYVTHLPKEDQAVLGPLVERLARGDWPVTSHWPATFAQPPSRAIAEYLEKARIRTRRNR
jgi:predicted DNA-binding protein